MTFTVPATSPDDTHLSNSSVKVEEHMIRHTSEISCTLISQGHVGQGCREGEILEDSEGKQLFMSVSERVNLSVFCEL